MCGKKDRTNKVGTNTCPNKCAERQIEKQSWDKDLSQQIYKKTKRKTKKKNKVWIIKQIKKNGPTDRQIERQRKRQME